MRPQQEHRDSWRLNADRGVARRVRRQLFLLLDDNYFSLSTTTTLLTLKAARSARRRAEGEARPRPGFSFRRKGIRGGGKVGNLLLVFHFSIRLLPPELWKCGNLACPWRDFQGAVERGQSLLLAFHPFHSPGISTALFFFWLRLPGYLSSGLRACGWLLQAGVFLLLAVL